MLKINCNTKMAIRFSLIIIIAILGFTLLSCTVKSKRYVGWTIRYDSPYVCKCDSLPDKCEIGDNDDVFVYNYDILKGSNQDEYICKGYFTGTGKGGWSEVGSGFRCRLLLIKDGTVVENIPVTFAGNDITRKLSFNKTFIGPPFDATVLSCGGRVVGH